MSVIPPQLKFVYLPDYRVSTENDYTIIKFIGISCDASNLLPLLPLTDLIVTVSRLALLNIRILDPPIKNIYSCIVRHFSVCI